MFLPLFPQHARCRYMSMDTCHVSGMELQMHGCVSLSDTARVFKGTGSGAVSGVFSCTWSESTCTADMKLGAMEGGQPAVLPSVTKKADFGSVEFLEQAENRRAVKV